MIVRRSSSEEAVYNHAGGALPLSSRVTAIKGRVFSMWTRYIGDVHDGLVSQSNGAEAGDANLAAQGLVPLDQSPSRPRSVARGRPAPSSVDHHPPHDPAPRIGQGMGDPGLESPIRRKAGVVKSGCGNRWAVFVLGLSKATCRRPRELRAGGSPGGSNVFQRQSHRLCRWSGNVALLESVRRSFQQS